MGKYDRVSLEKKYKREGYLEQAVSFIIIGFSILFSLFFFSFNLTGSFTDYSSIQDGNILGAVFLLVVIVGLFFHFKRSKLE